MNACFFCKPVESAFLANTITKYGRCQGKTLH
jgi:hypothetical protein